MSDFADGMRVAGKLAASTLLHLRSLVKAGVTTLELDVEAPTGLEPVLTV